MSVALITGAAGGIGQALCLAFKRAGHRVIATDLKQPGADYDVFLPVDLAQLVRDERCRDEFLSAVRSAVESAGGGRGLRVLVNNAAIQIVRSCDELTLGDWRATLDINLLAPFALTQGLLAELRRARGAVVNIGSLHARLTKPGFVCYATSKAALAGLTRSLAVDLAGGVRVNAIQPAATATPMLLAGFEQDSDAVDRLAGVHPMGRIAEPDEIARVAVYLASDDAAFIDGATLDVDGGIGARLHDPR